ncbi:MAG: 4-(cytidine 5'-diphospho)-2-C-methyl-D-erythritol kinase [Bacteroidetes bacterium]|nr:4-(cytidine 5'-diphospho)-2-C-methyl-D-erythritol kinase [Bacteroidota bacterium]
MISFPNAKINIGLNIIEKRDDGYHNIESAFYPVSLCDALEIIENTDDSNERISFTFSGIEIPGNTDDNLCWYAYHLIAADYVLPNVKVHLHKHIPIGAGLGGGSADAAFFIHLLNDKFELGISWGEMHNYARQLGSDCSFFISNKPSFAEGTGDQYESMKLDLRKYYVALVYPNIHINTAKAYSGVVPKIPTRSLENDLLNLPIEQWKEFVHNDFEDSVFLQFPELKKIKQQLYSMGAEYAAMSGSGSTVYGIFKNKTDLKNNFKNYFVWEGQF